jgi:hypothetical protein
VLRTLLTSGDLELDFSSLILVYLLLDTEEDETAELFNLTEKSDAFCLENFRFTNQEILLLKDVLGIPNVFRSTHSRHVRFSGVEG